jgi:lysylphosphatidylglycerol synthetase-like protein (DUF2156 family)
MTVNIVLQLRREIKDFGPFDLILRRTVRAPGLARAAATLLALEGIAVAVIAVVELVGLGAGDAASTPTAIALIVLTLIGAGALFAFAAGASRGRSWARSGAVVLQVLAVALALGSLSFDPVPWTFVAAVGVPAVVTFALLIASTRREAKAEPVDEG